ncbi:bifunctional 3,4-dihydroxy-2-butanone-4-phosphate synthase/GTP cyclohydrolase II [bacterium]|nr:bifunctional 3,4-dihydroxy-2-butanone-4-phosphate synthase/GTP cyclohydrolase II [bacterium]
MSAPFSPIEEAFDELRAGRMIILCDDEDRENEGDFIMAASKATPEAINFMTKHGRGMVCLSLTEERARELNLELMVPRNTALLGTRFTITIDAIEGTTTGISAADRAYTMTRACDANATPDDFGRPGHVHPIIAVEGGVLRRAGHTEGSTDLMRMAGMPALAVLCEIMNEDGTMSRVPDLEVVAKEFGLKMFTIRDIIEHRQHSEKLIEKKVEVPLPTKYGTFNLIDYHEEGNDKEHLAMVRGTWEEDEPILVRVHSECLTGDVLGSQRCDCGEQRDKALEMIDKEGKGIFLYMRQEGRGIGLAAKLKAYHLQDLGHDTVEANILLGYKADLRDYGIGAQILRDLGVKKMRLITNNPKKIVGLKGYGLEVVERVPLEIQPNSFNKGYMVTKREKMGHIIEKV